MKKVLSIIRWFLVMIVNLLGFLTAPIIYPILYPFRSLISSVKPFWFYFDDEDGYYGTRWFRDSLSYGDNKDWWSKFRVSYKWLALRNPAWNLQASLKPIAGQIKIKEVLFFDLVKNNTIVNSPLKFAVLKYVSAEGEYRDNKGEFLSLKYSTIGKVFVWYNIENKLYFRYSIAKNLFKKFWIEFHWGTGNRYVFRLKLKNNLKVYKE